MDEIEFPSPTLPVGSRTQVLLGYLRYYRAVLLAKLDGLPDQALRSSLLPSGWSPLELLKHLTYVELRWLDWGFAGQRFDAPWGDHEDDRWHVGPDETAEGLVAALQARARRTEEIATAHPLDAVGAPGERWDGAPPATLERVLLHVMNEYARHLGHLDVVRELLDGRTGEE